MQIDRRSLLACGALLPLVGSRFTCAIEHAERETADYALRIANGLAELAPASWRCSTMRDA